MPRGAIAGLIYWLGFCVLVFFALKHDLAVNQTAHELTGKPPINEQSNEGDHRTTNPTEEQRATAQPPGIIPTAPPAPLKEAGQSQPERSHQESKEGWWERLWTDPVATFTAALALFTLVLAAVALWQGVHLQRSVEVARASADALPAIERAYVFLEVSGMSKGYIDDYFATYNRGDGPSAGYECFINYQFVNQGKTPAIVRSISERFIRSPALPKPLTYNDEKLNFAIPGGGTFPPIQRSQVPNIRRDQPTTYREVTYSFNGESLFLGPDGNVKKFDAADAKGLMNGESLWFYGRIIYDDVFRVERETRFCWRYDGRDGTFNQYGEAENQRT